MAWNPKTKRPVKKVITEGLFEYIKNTNPGKVFKTYLCLPSTKGTDVKEALRQGVIDKNTKIIAIEKATIGEIDIQFYKIFIEKEKEAISLNEKLGRREVAKTMMEKDTHMAILEIIKEYGMSLREGSQGVKAYYEIAKTAYQEGFMAGLHRN